MANFFSNALGAVVHGTAAGAGTAYDYLTPGKGSSRVTNYGSDYFIPKPASSPTPSKPSTPATPAPNPYAAANAAADAQIAALNRQTQALMQQLAAQPRLPYYNTSAAWAQAQAAAQGVVDPVYTDKLNQYLQKEALGKKQTTEAEATTEANIQTQLAQALADTATNRTRAGEDQTTKIGDVNTAENAFQTNEGTAFDQARAALLGGVANSGLTTSGLGRQQDTTTIANRNTQSDQQTQQFTAARRDINTNATRTFEDLATADTRQQGAATANTAAAKKSLQDYIDNAALDEQGFRTNNEADRLGALASESGNQYKTLVGQFIAGLIGSGARPQDIALAQQIYGA